MQCMHINVLFSYYYLLAVDHVRVQVHTTCIHVLALAHKHVTVHGKHFEESSDRTNTHIDGERSIFMPRPHLVPQES